MFNRMFGGVLLIMGTSIGGGMLALPIVTAQAGFIPAVLLMVGVWFFMTMGAFWLLEVNLYLPDRNNLISMARATLGLPGQIVAWLSYLLLLYCLLSAYIAGGGDVTQHLLVSMHLSLPYWLSTVVFISVLGFVVSKGIESVDWVNRFLLLTKFASFTLISVLAAPQITMQHLSHLHSAYLMMALMPVITSFGFAIIIPNLRGYLKSDEARLKRVVLLGSLAPLICYIIWECAILGAVPLAGADGLTSVAEADRSTSALMTVIGTVSHSSVVEWVSRVFTTFCVGTSFLGVSLAMTHFLFDGMKLKPSRKNSGIIFLLTYLPPLTLVLFVPNAFIAGLSYAGICCVVLLVALPALMVWSARYRKKYSGYRVWGGKWLLGLTLALAFITIVRNVIELYA